MKISIVIPCYNEEKILEKNINVIRNFLLGKDIYPHFLKYNWEIIIADNGSTDRTLEIAKNLSQKYKNVSYTHLNQKGRGRVLKKCWLESKADILSYMDVDLSTNLKSFPELIKKITDGQNIAIGSRLIKGANTKRNLKREILSRGYNALVKILFQTKFSDAQCGFKAITKKSAQQLIPLIKDNSWFFDSELLILAEKRGYKISEVPVEWIEDLDSRVKIFKTVFDDIKGLLRMRFGQSKKYLRK